LPPSAARRARRPVPGRLAGASRHEAIGRKLMPAFSRRAARDDRPTGAVSSRVGRPPGRCGTRNDGFGMLSELIRSVLDVAQAEDARSFAAFASFAVKSLGSIRNRDLRPFYKRAEHCRPCCARVTGEAAQTVAPDGRKKLTTKNTKDRVPIGFRDRLRRSAWHGLTGGRCAIYWHCKCQYMRATPP